MSCRADEITALQFLDRYGHAKGWQDFALGRLDDADAGSRTLIGLGRQLGTRVHTLDALIVRVAVALLRGETGTAADLLRRAGDQTDADAAVRRPGLAVMTGWLTATRGSFEQAFDVLRPVIEGASKSRSYWPVTGATGQ